MPRNWVKVERKKCCACGKNKPVNQFNWKIKDVRLQSKCKVCSRLYARNHYQENKAMYIAKAHARDRARADEQQYDFEMESLRSGFSHDPNRPH